MSDTIFIHYYWAEENKKNKEESDEEGKKKKFADTNMAACILSTYIFKTAIQQFPPNIVYFNTVICILFDIESCENVFFDTDLRKKSKARLEVREWYRNANQVRKRYHGVKTPLKHHRDTAETPEDD